MVATLLRLALLGGVAVACGGGFKVRNYPTPVSLYAAGIAEFERGKWDNAITALDQVTILLPPRDTLLPRAMFYLARSYEGKKTFLLSSATFKRLFEDFPDDTLADDALFGMARAEEKSWRGPEFDAQPAVRARDAYSMLTRLHPNSPLVDSANAAQARMDEGLARGDVFRADFYLRRNVPDAALIYLRDASQMYPGTPSARVAMLRMVDVYRNRLKYVDDATDVCRALRAAYAADAAVARACAGLAADTTR